MFKSILTYVAAKKVITCVVLAAMLIGVMAVAYVAAVFAPKASADEMNPYAGKTFKMVDPRYGTSTMYVTEDGRALVRLQKTAEPLSDSRTMNGSVTSTIPTSETTESCSW